MFKRGQNKVQVFLIFCVLVLCFRKVKDLSSTSGPGKSSMLSSKGITSLHTVACLTRALSKFRQQFSGLQDHHSKGGN